MYALEVPIIWHGHNLFIIWECSSFHAMRTQAAATKANAHFIRGRWVSAIVLFCTQTSTPLWHSTDTQGEKENGRERECTRHSPGPNVMNTMNMKPTIRTAILFFDKWIKTPKINCEICLLFIDEFIVCTSTRIDTTPCKDTMGAMYTYYLECVRGKRPWRRDGNKYDFNVNDGDW